MTFPGVIFVSPPLTPPPSPVNPGRELLDQRWVDVNGRAWSFMGEESGVILMRGVRGLGMPTYTHFRDDYTGTDGSYWRGLRAQSREVFWPIYIFHDGRSRDWVEHYNAFWDGLSPRAEGAWVVQGPHGEQRKLRLRYEKGGEEAYELDPSFYGWAKYGIHLRADQPYWEGAAIPRSWRTSEPVFFFGDDDEAPPFHISPPPSAEQATMTNPGDVATWPTWTLEGPLLEGTRVGVDGQAVELGFDVPSGSTLVIDTRPTAQTAILDGVDRTRDLASYGFAEIPPGKDVPVEVTLIAPPEGVGSATIEIVPLYERAF